MNTTKYRQTLGNVLARKSSKKISLTFKERKKKMIIKTYISNKTYTLVKTKQHQHQKTKREKVKRHIYILIALYT